MYLDIYSRDKIRVSLLSSKGDTGSSYTVKVFQLVQTSDSFTPEYTCIKTFDLEKARQDYLDLQNFFFTSNICSSYVASRVLNEIIKYYMFLCVPC